MDTDKIANRLKEHINDVGDDVLNHVVHVEDVTFKDGSYHAHCIVRSADDQKIIVSVSATRSTGEAFEPGELEDLFIEAISDQTNEQFGD
jgi:hypothetical protein